MKLFFVGAGKMNAALIRGLLTGKACAAEDVVIATRTRAKADVLASETGIRVSDFPEQDAAGADAVILGVKPVDAALALGSLGAAREGRLLISIVSGLGIASLAELAPGAHIVRAMPNTPLQCLAGMTVLAAADDVRDAERQLAQEIFAACGEVALVAESSMDAVTAVSGSGPAYFFLMIEALADAGVTAGLSRDLASQLAVQTAFGAAKLARESGMQPTLLREQVMSPGGTTAAALRALEAKAFRAALLDAVMAARDRAEELGRPS